MSEEKEEYNSKKGIKSNIQSFFSWKGWQGVFNIVTIGLAVYGIFLAFQANRFTVESGKPMLSINNRVGFKPRSLVHAYIGAGENFNYMIPLLQITFTNNGDRNAEEFQLKSEAIFPITRKIFKRKPVSWGNAIAPNERRIVSAYPAVPVDDLEEFYFKLSFYWYDKKLETNDSLQVVYHCYQRGDKGYDLFGLNNQDVDFLRNKTDSFEVLDYNKSVKENINRFYLPKRFSYK